jgi:ATP-dependent DNA ligase
MNLFEPKLDGFRALAFTGPAIILSLKGTNLGFAFPEKPIALAQLPVCILDGD